MATKPVYSPLSKDGFVALWAVWSGTLFASYLPIIIWRDFLAGDASEIVWVRLVAAGVLIVLPIAFPALRLLRCYALILLAIIVGDEFVRPLVARSALWQSWFGVGGGWFWQTLGTQLLRLLPSLGALVLLLIMGLRRRDFFLVTGRLDAKAEPVPWLGIKATDSWTRVGRNFAVVLATATLVVLALSTGLEPGDLGAILPLLPAAALFAALNAFNENFAYRAAPLAPLLGIVGKNQAVLLTATFFGLGHFDGSPPGVTGVLMAGFLGWLLAKSMVETKGFLCAWLIQFPLDVVVFALVWLPAAAA